MTKNDMISIVVPCYNEEESIMLFYKEMEKIRKKFLWILNIFL